MSCGAWQPEELTLLLIQLRRHQAKMASARQHALTQLQRLNGPKEPFHHNHLLTPTTTSTSPLLGSSPSPVSHLGHVGTKVGAPCRTSACLPLILPGAGRGCHYTYCRTASLLNKIYHYYTISFKQINFNIFLLSPYICVVFTAICVAL